MKRIPKAIKAIATFILVIILYQFPYYIFTAEYRKNPHLYLAKRLMMRILDKEIVHSIYLGNELKVLYKEKFGSKHPYDSIERERLNDISKGGQHFWDCIKEGKLYISNQPQNVMLTYRHTNKIGTCELTVQHFEEGWDGTDSDASAIYFDKRLNIGIATLTNTYDYYGER